MARLIEVQQSDQLATPLLVRVGDVLVFQATGARISEGASALELWGPFVSATVGENGAVLDPMGFPNAVLARARGPGQATLELFTGDPFHRKRTTSIRITIEA
jgi:hypothetical protein